MALNSNRVTTLATPGLAAAATGRPASGGRNVATANGLPLEAAGFSPQIGINDNRLLRYEEDLHFEFGDQPQSQPRGTPFVIRAATGFKAETAEEAAGGETGGVFLSMVLRGIGTYERNMRVTSGETVRPGSVMNYLS